MRLKQEESDAKLAVEEEAKLRKLEAKAEAYRLTLAMEEEAVLLELKRRQEEEMLRWEECKEETIRVRVRVRVRCFDGRRVKRRQLDPDPSLCPLKLAGDP